MSVPLWRRPPERGKPHESMKDVAPGVIGQMKPEVAWGEAPAAAPDLPWAWAAARAAAAACSCLYLRLSSLHRSDILS